MTRWLVLSDAQVSLLLFLLFLLAPPFAFSCDRIISLSPSITEVVAAINLGERLIAVSSFDKDFAEQHSVPMVGNLFDLQTEAVVSLNPSVVFLLVEQRRLKERLDALSIPSVTVDHRTLEGIHRSVSTIAERCHRVQAGQDLLRQMNAEVQDVLKGVQQADQTSTPRVLIVIGSGQGSGALKKLYVSGRDGFFYPLLLKIGAEPVFDELTTGMSALSSESIVKLQPTHILHILPPGREIGSLEEYRKVWEWYPALPALQKDQIFVRNERVFSIPGIYYPKVLAEFVEMFR